MVSHYSVPNTFNVQKQLLFGVPLIVPNTFQCAGIAIAWCAGTAIDWCPITVSLI